MDVNLTIIRNYLEHQILSQIPEDQDKMVKAEKEINPETNPDNQ
jgi:hypothetical protein